MFLYLTIFLFCFPIFIYVFWNTLLLLAYNYCFPAFYGLKADLNISYSPLVILTLLESTVYDSNTVALFSLYISSLWYTCFFHFFPNKPVHCYLDGIHREKYKLVLILVSLYYWDKSHDQWQLGSKGFISP